MYLRPAFAPALLCALGTPAAADVRVELKPRVPAAGSVVTVGDVADLSPASPADALDAARLARVPLAPAPPAGASRVVTAAAVRRRAEAGGFRVTLAGAAAARVRTPARVEPDAPPPATAAQLDWADRFAEGVLSRALARSSGPAPAVELALHADAAAVLAAARPAGCDVAGLDPRARTPQTVKLRWLDAGDRVRSVPVAVRLTAAPVPVAPIPAAPAVSPTAPVAAAAANAPSVAEQARRGARTHQKPAPGPPLVRANQVVTVETSAGGVRVTRALKSGRTAGLGETVPLTVPGTRDRVFARVVGNRRAVIVGTAAKTEPYAGLETPATKERP